MSQERLNKIHYQAAAGAKAFTKAVWVEAIIVGEEVASGTVVLNDAPSAGSPEISLLTAPVGYIPVKRYYGGGCQLVTAAAQLKVSLVYREA